MIAPLRELIPDVGLELVDHHDRYEHRRRDAADRSGVGRGHYADDRVLAFVDVDCAADDRPIGVVVLAPESIADHGDAILREERTASGEAGTKLR